MAKNSLMIDLDDPRAGQIAEVLSNKTAIAILGALADEELSASELADKLGVPLNTVGYNIDKLVATGLIEQVKGFLWSVKGKRIHKYKVSNRKIIISPRTKVKGVIPAILGALVIGAGLKIYEFVSNQQKDLYIQAPTAADTTNSLYAFGANVSDIAAKGIAASGNEAADSVAGATEALTASAPEIANQAAGSGGAEGFYSHISHILLTTSGKEIWFILGTLTALVIVLLWNKRHRK